MKQVRQKARVPFFVSIIATLVLMGGAILLCWFAYASVERSVFQASAANTLDTLDVVRDLGIEAIDDRIRGVKAEVKTNATKHADALAEASDEASVARVLASLELSEDGEDYWYLTREGQLIGLEGAVSSWESVMPPADPAAILKTEDPKLVGPAYNAGNVYVLAASAPVMRGGTVEGVLIERLDGYCVSEWIAPLSFNVGGGVAYLVEGSGRNIAASRTENYEWFESEYNASELALSGDAEAVSVAALERLPLEGKTGRGTYKWDQGTSYAAYGPITEADWGLLVGFYGNSLESYVSDVVAHNGGNIAQIWLVLLVLLLGLIALVSVRSLRKERTATVLLKQQKDQIEQQTEALMASEARFRVALEKTGNIVFDYDIVSGDIQCFTTPEDAQHCDATKEKLRSGLVAEGEVEDDSLTLFCDALDDLRHGARRAECMLEVCGTKGDKLWYRASLSTLSASDGSPLRAIGVLENVTKEREAEYDSLTGLLDRKAVVEAAQATLAEASPEDVLAFIMVDVDRFKQVNDTFGHPMGDKVLQRVARVLVDAFDPSDVVARFGGDEFCVFCASNVSKKRLEQAMALVNETLQHVERPGEESRVLSCSFGVSLQRGDTSWECLQTEADKALYVAKRAGRCTFAFHEGA